MLRGYEQDHWLASGGTMDTWGPRLPTPSQVATNPANVPDSPEAWVKAGAAHMQNANYAEGLAAFERALQLNPANALVHTFKGAALNDLGRHQEALIAYDRALALNPNDPANWHAHARFYRVLGRLREAEAAERRAKGTGRVGVA
jgi:tetratricopeptide (TPR) repeat protein